MYSNDQLIQQYLKNIDANLNNISKNLERIANRLDSWNVVSPLSKKNKLRTTN